MKKGRLTKKGYTKYIGNFPLTNNNDKYNVREIKRNIEEQFGFEVVIYKPYFFKILDSEKQLDIYPKSKRCFKINERRWENYNDIYELVDDYFLNGFLKNKLA